MRSNRAPPPVAHPAHWSTLKGLHIDAPAPMEVLAVKPKKPPQPNEHYRCKAKPKRRRRYKTSELMADFKPEHRHVEWDVGPPVGKEIW